MTLRLVANIIIAEMRELRLNSIVVESISRVSIAIRNMDAEKRQFGHKANLMKEPFYAGRVEKNLRFTSI